MMLTNQAYTKHGYFCTLVVRRVESSSTVYIFIIVYCLYYKCIKTVNINCIIILLMNVYINASA